MLATRACLSAALLLAMAPLASAQSEASGWGLRTFDSSWTDGFVELATGWTTTVGRRADGSLVGWGDDQYGSCQAPPLPAGLGWTQVSVGQSHTLALRSDGNVIGWGANGNGQLNLPPLPAGTTYTQVSAAGFSSLALRSDGQVVGAGYNGSGQLNVPPPPPGRVYVAVEVDNHGLGLLDDGNVVAWGSNGFGQGNVPALPPGRVYVEIDAEVNKSSARLDDGSVVVFGQQSLNLIPPAGTTYVEVALGVTNVLVLRSDGVVEAYGGNTWGESNVPAPPAGHAFVEVDAGDRYAMARLDDGRLFTWGLNEDLALNLPSAPAGAPYVRAGAGAGGSGGGGPELSSIVARTALGTLTSAGGPIGNAPTLPPGLVWREVSTGGAGAYPPFESAGHALGLRSDGLVSAWGSNSKGQCNVPALPAGTSYTAVSAGWRHSVALRSDGTAIAWGDNTQGQSSAALPAPGTVFVQVGAGADRSAALQSDGAIAVWGSAPAAPPLPAGTVYVELAVGAYHMLARRSDGAVVGWGNNSSGETQMPPLPAGRTVLSLSAGNTYSLALLDDGSVLGWGNGSYGRADAPALPNGRIYATLDAGHFSSAATHVPLAPPSAYCTSKPTSLPGCVPTLTAPLHAASVAAGARSYELRAGPVPGGALVAVALYSTSGAAAAPIQTSFGALCIASPLSRIVAGLPNGTSGTCNGAYALDLGAHLATQQVDPALVAGATFDVQLWYRDPPNPGGANLTHALSFELAP